MSLALEIEYSHACGEMVFHTRVIFDKIFHSKFLFRKFLALEVEYSHACVVMVLSQNYISSSCDFSKTTRVLICVVIYQITFGISQNTRSISKCSSVYNQILECEITISHAWETSLKITN